MNAKQEAQEHIDAIRLLLGKHDDRVMEHHLCALERIIAGMEERPHPAAAHITPKAARLRQHHESAAHTRARHQKHFA